VYATILAGDAERSSQISGLTMALPPGEVSGTEAIVCDRGNAARSPRPPNALVSHVEIHGFEVGVRVTWSGPPLSGCNLSLTSSSIHDGWFGERNDFGPLTTGGIGLWGPIIVDELLDNSIHDNSMVAGFHFGVPDGPLLDTADASTASTPPCPAGRVAGH
jgi:hypothetical protein